MAGLQRSEVSFRRQGSSGLVWDDRFLSGELNKVNQNDQDHQEQGKETDHHHHQKPEITEAVKADAKPTVSIQRTRSSSGYRTGKVSPAVEPPSPKLSACGFCGAFGKTEDKGHRRKKPAKRRSR